MQTLSFRKLARELEAAGVATSVIVRITQELKDHCSDAEAEAIARGASRAEARRQAKASLGSPASIVAAISARPNLLDWRHRWPQSARCVDCLAYCLVLPAAPFVYCCAQPSFIVRWGLSSSLAVCVTGSILFAMQWLIRSAVLI